jgi:hypothetical protein
MESTSKESAWYRRTLELMKSRGWVIQENENTGFQGFTTPGGRPTPEMPHGVANIFNPWELLDTPEDIPRYMIDPRYKHCIAFLAAALEVGPEYAPEIPGEGDL